MDSGIKSNYQKAFVSCGMWNISLLYAGRCALLCQDDMNLTEEKKGPLRSMPISQKKMMLEKFFQSKGT